MAIDEKNELEENSEVVIADDTANAAESQADTDSTENVDNTETTETEATETSSDSEEAKDSDTPFEPTNNSGDNSSDNGSPAPDGGKKTGSKGILKIAGVILLVAAVVIILIVCLGGNGSVKGRLVGISGKAVSCKDELIFNRGADTAVVDLKVTAIAQNRDRSAMVCYTKEKDEYTLWYVDSKLQPAKIDSVETLSYTVVSDDGKYVVYAVRNGDSVDDANLFIYDVKNGESIKVAKDIIPESVVSSPNGKTVAYITNWESLEDNDMYVTSIDSEAVKVAKNGCIAVAVADGGKSVIYVNVDDDKLYYYNGKEAVKVASDVDYESIFTNVTETEVVYNKDGKTYWYKAGNEAPNKIYSKEVAYFVCDTQRWIDMEIEGRTCLDTFKNAIFVDEDYKVLTISNNADDVNKITSKYGDFTCSNDGKEMVYTEGDELYYAKLNKNEEPAVIYESEKINTVVSNANLSRIYIVNEDDELIYVTKSGKHEMITNDIDSDYRPIVCESTGKVYFIEDGDLYEANKTKKSKVKIKSDVVKMEYTLGGLLYMTDDERVGLIF